MTFDAADAAPLEKWSRSVSPDRLSRNNFAVSGTGKPAASLSPIRMPELGADSGSRLSTKVVDNSVDSTFRQSYKPQRHRQIVKLFNFYTCHLANTNQSFICPI